MFKKYGTPSGTVSMSGVLDLTWYCSVLPTSRLNVALKEGSSMQGKTLLMKVGPPWVNQHLLGSPFVSLQILE